MAIVRQITANANKITHIHVETLGPFQTVSGFGQFVLDGVVELVVVDEAQIVVFDGEVGLDERLVAPGPLLRLQLAQLLPGPLLLAHLHDLPQAERPFDELARVRLQLHEFLAKQRRFPRQLAAVDAAVADVDGRVVLPGGRQSLLRLARLRWVIRLLFLREERGEGEFSFRFTIFCVLLEQGFVNGFELRFAALDSVVVLVVVLVELFQRVQGVPVAAGVVAGGQLEELVVNHAGFAVVPLVDVSLVVELVYHHFVAQFLQKVADYRLGFAH